MLDGPLPLAPAAVAAAAAVVAFCSTKGKSNVDNFALPSNIFDVYRGRMLASFVLTVLI